jgi:hypothetical protein
VEIPTPLRFRLVALGFALGAAIHLTALLSPAFVGFIGSSSPPWRHALFTAIDGTVAAAMLWRPPILAVALAVMLAQQISTHGRRAWLWWAHDGRLDWYSLGLLAFILYALVAVVADLRARRRDKTAQLESSNAPRN